MRPLIVIPAKNEKDSIAKVIQDIKHHCKYDILVIDDASTDNTAEIAKSNKAIVLSHAVNLGAWKATQTGMRYAKKNGYDKVVTMDADGQHPPTQINTLLTKSTDGYDLVIGSCVQRGSTLRKFAWRTFRLIGGLGIQDLTSGFRVYSKPLMYILSGKSATMLDFQDVGVLLFVRHFNLNAAEVNVEMMDRQDGVSRIFHSWGAVIGYIFYTTVLMISKALPFFGDNYKRKLLGESEID